MKPFLFIMAVVLASLTFNSCSNDDGYSLDKFWIAPATVVPISNNSFYLRLDGGETLWPAAPVYINYDAKVRQRAWVNFTILGDSISGYSHSVKINRIYDILTKDIAPNKHEENDSIYGKDPVQITNPKSDLWIGDNFLNIVFIANFGGIKQHFVNVIQPKSDEPYTLEFRHNAYDDPAVSAREGIVCFRLDNLPSTEGKTVPLKVRIKTFEGDKEYTLDYKTGSSPLPQGRALPEENSLEMLK